MNISHIEGIADHEYPSVTILKENCHSKWKREYLGAMDFFFPVALCFPCNLCSLPPSCLPSSLCFFSSVQIVREVRFAAHRRDCPSAEQEDPITSWKIHKILDVLACIFGDACNLCGFKLWGAFHENKPAWNLWVISSAWIEYCKEHNSLFLRGKFMKRKLL